MKQPSSFQISSESLVFDVLFSDLKHFDSLFQVHIKDRKGPDSSTTPPASPESEIFAGIENSLLLQVIRKWRERVVPLERPSPLSDGLLTYNEVSSHCSQKAFGGAL